MDKSEVLDFITKHPTAYLATAEGSQPHVRAMGTYRADENGIIFAMQSDKDVYKQLTGNPQVEVCYFAGKLIEDKSQALKEEVTEKRTFYKPGVEQHGWDYVGVFRMTEAKATALDMKAPPSPSGKVWTDL